jgi:hypothetical protein
MTLARALTCPGHSSRRTWRQRERTLMRESGAYGSSRMSRWAKPAPGLRVTTSGRGRGKDPDPRRGPRPPIDGPPTATTGTCIGVAGRAVVLPLARWPADRGLNAGIIDFVNRAACRETRVLTRSAHALAGGRGARYASLVRARCRCRPSEASVRLDGAGFDVVRSALKCPAGARIGAACSRATSTVGAR